MSSQPPKSILIIGLAPHPSSTSAAAHHTSSNTTNFGPPDQVRLTVQSEIQRLKDHGNYDICVKLVDPSNHLPMLNEIGETSKAKRWDGFNVGFGVRGTPEYTEVFEALVNAAREISPDTKMSFNSRPDDLFESVIRNY